MSVSMEGAKISPKDSLPTFKMSDINVLGVLIAIAAVILTLVLFGLWRRRKSTRRSVLLTGLCDTGKTLLFARLLHNKVVSTYTSMQENVAEYQLKNGSLRIVDIPGQERLRGKFFDKYKASARGIVFVVDSVAFQKEIRDVAEYLYTILTDSAVRGNCPHVLILCNKQDQTMAKGMKVVQALLEKELNLLRSTKSHQLSSIEGSADASRAYLGSQGRDFEFTQCAPISVQLAEAAAVAVNDATADRSVQMDELKLWLNQLV